MELGRRLASSGSTNSAIARRESFSHWEKVPEGPDEGRSFALTRRFAAPSPRGRGTSRQAGERAITDCGDGVVFPLRPQENHPRLRQLRFLREACGDAA